MHFGKGNYKTNCDTMMSATQPKVSRGKVIGKKVSAPKILIAKLKPEELIFHGDRPVAKAVGSNE